VVGDVGRNVLHGPHLFNIDASVFRTLEITGRLKLEFRAESYNLTNTHWLDNPDTTMGDAAFGQLTTAQGTQSVKVNRFLPELCRRAGTASIGTRYFRAHNRPGQRVPHDRTGAGRTKWIPAISAVRRSVSEACGLRWRNLRRAARPGRS
jgi:hypothetical protein